MTLARATVLTSGAPQTDPTDRAARLCLKLSLRAIIVGDQPGDVYALNPKTGVQLWVTRDPGPINSPAIAKGVVYVERDSGPISDGQPIGLDAAPSASTSGHTCAPI